MIIVFMTAACNLFIDWDQHNVFRMISSLSSWHQHLTHYLHDLYQHCVTSLDHALNDGCKTVIWGFTWMCHVGLMLWKLFIILLHAKETRRKAYPCTELIITLHWICCSPCVMWNCSCGKVCKCEDLHIGCFGSDSVSMLTHFTAVQQIPNSFVWGLWKSLVALELIYISTANGTQNPAWTWSPATFQLKTLFSHSQHLEMSCQICQYLLYSHLWTVRV